MKWSAKGSYTVELAWLLPILLGIFVLMLYALFYFYDKNIVAGAMYETLVVGCGRTNDDEEVLHRLLQDRMEGKLLLFECVETQVEIEGDRIRIGCTARQNRFSFSMEQQGERLAQETYIRSIRKLEEIGGLGE